MNSYVNMAIGGLLGTVFVLMSVSIASEGIFHSETPEKPGFEIVAAEAGAETGGAATEAAAEAPIGPMLASADATAGATIFKKCLACHSADKGGPNKVGPNLWGVVDRPVASHEGFAYSAGMKASVAANPKWDYEHLAHFLLKPKSAVPGTAMGFAGLPKEQDRANLIAYLRTLADTPVPLPAAQ